MLSDKIALVVILVNFPAYFPRASCHHIFECIATDNMR